MSCTPASWRRRLTAGEATRPVPRGAGMSYIYHIVSIRTRELPMVVAQSMLTLTVTLPHFPLSFVGRECGSPRDVPQ